jgi:hypothetical protein
MEDIEIGSELRKLLRPSAVMTILNIGYLQCNHGRSNDIQNGKVWRAPFSIQADAKIFRNSVSPKAIVRE